MNLVQKVLRGANLGINKKLGGLNCVRIEFSTQ